jgi:adenylate cyclase, class 2
MFHEYETKVLDINVSEIEEKLQKLGAAVLKPETLMRRRVFDVQAHSGNTGKRFRLRQQGDKTTLTYKERWGKEIGATKELETEIGDFDVMAELLQKLERQTMVYQENKRKVFSRNDVEFCIDTRPMIPTYMEIEAPSKEQVEEALKLLQLEWKDVGDMWMIELYEKHGINLHDHKVLKFEK